MKVLLSLLVEMSEHHNSLGQGRYADIWSLIDGVLVRNESSSLQVAFKRRQVVPLMNGQGLHLRFVASLRVSESKNSGLLGRCRCLDIFELHVKEGSWGFWSK